MSPPASANRTPRHPTTVERTSDLELKVTRFVDAPPSLVFDAWTKPELLARWWAPRSRGVELFECQAEVRVGGRYRYLFGRDRSRPMAFSGRYLEVAPPSRLVFTEVFEPMAEAGEAVVVLTFEPRGAGTLLTMTERYPSKEALDGAVATGMTEGMDEAFGQLDELVAA